MPASLSNMVTKVTLRGGIQSNEFGSTDLQDLILEAVGLHNDSYLSSDRATCTIPDREVYACTLLSLVQVAMVRAARLSRDGTVSGAGGIGTDRNTPFYKCLAYVEKVQGEYMNICKGLGLEKFYSGSSNPIEGTVVGRYQDIQTPTGVFNSQFKASVTIGASTVTTTAQLTVDFTQSVDFLGYNVYHLVGNSGIVNHFNSFASTGDPINAAASHAGTITDQRRTHIELNLASATVGVVHYFVVVVQYGTGERAVSNVVSATQA